ncbi:MAG TPA: hypothetical protein VIR58_09365, partial [Acidimicrobiales bacterium]
MLRRTIALLATTAVLALAAPSPAGAEAPPLGDYAAGGSATALVLTLLGQELAVSDTSAAISSVGPEAAADGAALLLAGTPVPGAAPSKAPGGAGENQVCAAEADLDELSGGALSALGLGLGCVNTSAAIVDGGPTAESSSGELVIELTGPAGSVLEPILTPLFDTLPQVTDPLLDALEPILGPITDATGIDLPQILDDLLANVQDETFVLAQIVVAPTASQASADAADGVVGRAGANGVTINLLPGIAATLEDLGLGIAPSAEPLVSVKLGQSYAEVVRDPVTGAAKADASAAQLLSIDVNDTLGILQELTGQLTGVLDTLAVDQLACSGANPLADVVCIELGSVTELSDADLKARGLDFGAGTVGRAASAANIQILPVLAD